MPVEPVEKVAHAELSVEPIDANFSLKDKIYDSLKQAITSMNIYADDVELRLDERRLSEKLEISRTPLREALARLHADGDDYADAGPAPQRPLTARPDNARAWHLPGENHQGPDETETTTAGFAHARGPGFGPACRSTAPRPPK